MAYYYFREIWTPLKLIGIKLFRDDQGELWYKLFVGRRKRWRSN